MPWEVVCDTMGGGLMPWKVVWRYGRWSDAKGVMSCSGVKLLSFLVIRLFQKTVRLLFFFGLIYIDVQDFFVERFWDVAR